MPGVVFAFGDRPGLSAAEALELAALLETTRTSVALEAASQIRSEATRDPGQGEASSYVALRPSQLRLLYEVLREVSPTFDSEAIVRLRIELMRELNLAGDA